MKVIVSQHRVSGSINVPGSKSHTIRACIFALLADGISKIYNPLPGEDCLAAVRVAEAAGAKVKIEEGLWTIEGLGSKLPVPGFVVDVGDSGTLLHLFAGVAASIPGYTVITGDKSICSRPIRGQLRAFEELGAEAFTTREDTDAPPAIIRGPIKSGTAHLVGDFSQHVSGLLIAGALSHGTFRIELSAPKELPFLKMTIDWLDSLGIKTKYDEKNFSFLEISGPNRFPPFERTIPSDWEGAAFPLVAAVLSGGRLTINNIDCSGSQGDEAAVDVLREMGADIVVNRDERRLIVNGASGGNNGSGGRSLRGVTANLAGYPDALPILAVAAAYAEGVSRFTDIGVCRRKETDRIAVMKSELEKIGARVVEGEDFLEVHGKAGGENLHGGTVESYGDHRVAMAMAVAGLALPGAAGREAALTVNDAGCCAVSFPGFYETMNRCGAGFILKES